MVRIFPESVVKLWNGWELRVLVLSSLLLQIVLILCGGRRKYSTKIGLRIVTWIAYLSADSVATVALGMISNLQGDEDGEKKSNPHPDSQILAFWAPFLLVHLGGPDTITAYALEDNELWLRHLLGLLVQVGVALYIFVRSWGWSTYRLSLLAIPMFVAGIIKYGERTWALRCASSEKFRDSLLPDPITRSREMVARAGTGGIIVRVDHDDFGINTSSTGIPEGAVHLHEAFLLFNYLKHLYADVILDYNDAKRCYTMLKGYSSRKVFKILEIELSLLFDVLYTKASIVYSRKGFIFRSISLACYISTFTVFFFIDKQQFLDSKKNNIDVFLTYLLSIGAISLELYAICVIVFSDQTLYLLSKPNQHQLAHPIYQAISSFNGSSSPLSYGGKRWRGSMEKFNLIEFCLMKEKRGSKYFGGIQRLIFSIYQMSEKYGHYTTTEHVPNKMKQIIFDKLKDIAKKVVEDHDDEEGEAKGKTHDDVLSTQVITWRGSHALQKRKCNDEWINRTVIEVPFDESILLWHIATDLCYYYDLDHKHDERHLNDDSRHKFDEHEVNYLKCSKLSKSLSDYMMYIIVKRPSMLPKGMWQMKFHDTCAEVIAAFGIKKYEVNAQNLCRVLYGMGTQLVPSSGSTSDEAKNASETVLFKACRLAKKLQSLRLQEEKWEMISQVWVEMLCYAANQCAWKEHAQQLRRGGELLTHVSLLMANLGLSEQFQIHQPSKMFLGNFE